MIHRIEVSCHISNGSEVKKTIYVLIAGCMQSFPHSKAQLYLHL